MELYVIPSKISSFFGISKKTHNFQKKMFQKVALRPPKNYPIHLKFFSSTLTEYLGKVSEFQLSSSSSSKVITHQSW